MTFEVGTNPDIAQVNVQNRLALAQPRLPEEVVRQGIAVRKQSTNLLQVVNLTSPQGTATPSSSATTRRSTWSIRWRGCPGSAR